MTNQSMRVYLFLLFYSVLFNIYSQDKKEILFVGNSFTFYWNLPKLVEDMAKSRGLNWKVSQSTSSGVTLEQHWNSRKGLQTISLIEENNFDYIIYQDRSHNPIRQLDSTEVYAKKFINLSKSKNSIPFLFSTWFYPEYWEREYPNNKIDLNTNPFPIESVISRISKEEKIDFIPVGRAFKLFQQKYPNYNLLFDDDKHSSANGSYLAACIIFSSISGESSVGLPSRFFEYDEKENKWIYFNIVDKNFALLSQKISNEIVSQYK